MVSAEFATVAIAHNIKKMISVMEAGSKEVGDFCYPAKSPTLLTPEEAGSLRRGVAYIYKESDQ